MDSPEQLKPPSPWQFSQVPDEEDSAGMQADSEVLAKNLSDFTLNPSTKFLSTKTFAPTAGHRKNFKRSGMGLSQGMRRCGVKGSKRNERKL